MSWTRRKWIALAAIIGVILLDAALIWHYVRTPAEAVGREVHFVIPFRSTLRSVSESLAAEGVIRNPLAFRLLARWRNLDGRIRVGRFLVRTDWSPDAVLHHLAFGLQDMDRVTLPEGLPIWEVGRRLEAAGFVRGEDFDAVCREREFLDAHRVPFPSAEGFLYPDTYTMMRPLELNRATARVVVGAMIDAFWRSAGPLFGPDPDPESVRRAVILASVVERETSVPGERARVAGVYANRLKKRMRMQADPTVAYGLGRDFVGPLYFRHLEDAANPYNTYCREGLPPGPICSPGLECLRAAVRPEEHGYLYFVATGSGDGAHVFSKTYAGHAKAVEEYRRRKGAR